MQKSRARRLAIGRHAASAAVICRGFSYNSPRLRYCARYGKSPPVTSPLLHPLPPLPSVDVVMAIRPNRKQRLVASLATYTGGATPGPAGAHAPAGKAVPRLVGKNNNNHFLHAINYSVPRTGTMVPRLCPGLSHRLAPPLATYLFSTVTLFHKVTLHVHICHLTFPQTMKYLNIQ